MYMYLHMINMHIYEYVSKLTYICIYIVPVPSQNNYSVISDIYILSFYYKKLVPITRLVLSQYSNNNKIIVTKDKKIYLLVYTVIYAFLDKPTRISTSMYKNRGTKLLKFYI